MIKLWSAKNERNVIVFLGKSVVCSVMLLKCLVTSQLCEASWLDSKDPGIYTSTKTYTFNDYGDHGQFYFSFYAGYEFVDISSTLDKGDPRIGFMSYMRYGGFATTGIDSRRFDKGDIEVKHFRTILKNIGKGNSEILKELGITSELLDSNVIIESTQLAKALNNLLEMPTFKTLVDTTTLTLPLGTLDLLASTSTLYGEDLTKLNKALLYAVYHQQLFELELYGCHPLSYGLHHSIAARLTSSAEQKISNSTGTVSESEKAFEFETQLFWPWARTKRRDVQCHIGPTVVLGGKKSKKPQLDPRYYAGIRLIKNPEFYTDFLVGHTGGLDSIRAEVRGQMPIHRFKEESELLFGAVANVGITPDKNEVRDSLGNLTKRAEEDIVRIYFMWNVDFAELAKNR